MKKYGFLRILIPALLALSLSLPVAAGNIFMDENFEGAAAFVNVGYPSPHNKTDVPTSVNITATQGINVRALSDDSATVPISVTNEGVLSSSFALSGSKSLQIAAGKKVALVKSTPSYSNAALNWLQVMQFAVTVDSDALALPSGTRIGYYKQEWSTDGDNSSVEVTYQLNFVRNSSGGVDVIVNNDSVKAGSISEAGQWAVITVIAQKDINSPSMGGLINWECYDPLVAIYKGPQPTGNPIGDGSGNGSGTYFQHLNGIYVYVNNNAAGDYITAAALGSNWCNDPGAAADSKANNTYLLGWEIKIENGGKAYVDDMFWSVGLFQNDTAVNGSTQDGAARMVNFTAPLPPPSEASSLWLLSE